MSLIRNKEHSRKTNHFSRTKTVHRNPPSIFLIQDYVLLPFAACYRFDVRFSEQSRGGRGDICHGEVAADIHAMADAGGL